MGIKITGLDSLQKKLNNMSKAAEEMNGKHNVPMTDLFTNTFMSENTTFSDAQTFFDSSGFDFNSQEAFEAIPQEELDSFVNKTTDFENWQEMITEASKIYTLKKLGF